MAPQATHPSEQNMTTGDYGSGTVYLRGTRWHIAYHHRGHLYRESSRSTDRRVAVRLLRRRLSEIHVGALGLIAIRGTAG